MKPLVTWALIANSGTAHVVANHGPAKGFETVGLTWKAAPPVEYADKPGIEKSGSMHGQVNLTNGDPKDAAETAFATLVAAKLTAHAQKDSFDRLIVAAGPSMLGKLRAAIPPNVAEMILGELDKDLTHVGIQDLAGHLKHVIAA